MIGIAQVVLEQGSISPPPRCQHFISRWEGGGGPKDNPTQAKGIWSLTTSFPILFRLCSPCLGGQCYQSPHFAEEKQAPGTRLLAQDHSPPLPPSEARIPHGRSFHVSALQPSTGMPGVLPASWDSALLVSDRKNCPPQGDQWPGGNRILLSMFCSGRNPPLRQSLRPVPGLPHELNMPPWLTQ